MAWIVLHPDRILPRETKVTKERKRQKMDSPDVIWARILNDGLDLVPEVIFPQRSVLYV